MDLLNAMKVEVLSFLIFFGWSVIFIGIAFTLITSISMNNSNDVDWGQGKERPYNAFSKAMSIIIGLAVVLIGVFVLVGVGNYV